MFSTSRWRVGEKESEGGVTGGGGNKEQLDGVVGKIEEQLNVKEMELTELKRKYQLERGEQVDDENSHVAFVFYALAVHTYGTWYQHVYNYSFSSPGCSSRSSSTFAAIASSSSFNICLSNFVLLDGFVLRTITSFERLVVPRAVRFVHSMRFVGVVGVISRNTIGIHYPMAAEFDGGGTNKFLELCDLALLRACSYGVRVMPHLARSPLCSTRVSGVPSRRLLSPL